MCVIYLGNQCLKPRTRIFQLPKLLILLCSILLSSQSLAQSLRVGTTLWPGYEPLYLAQEIKAYKENIRMINYPSTSEVLRAFKNRTVEVAALTLDEVVQLAESDIDVEIILVLDISDGADVIMAKPNVKNMQGLIGAKIAVESTAVGAYILSRALEVHNIKIEQVSLVNVENSSHKDAYINKLADAVVTYEPVRTQLLNEGAIEVFNSKEISGEVVDVLVAHKDVVNNHQEALVDISQGWFKALKQIQDEPVDSYRFIASRMKVSTREAKESYFGLTLPSLAENKTLLTGPDAPLRQTFKRLTQHMKNSGLIRQGTQPEVVLNSSFLPE
jgi:NitT/TauT family transport system substrate-binding protein